MIARHEGVSEVAVIGALDLNWGEIPLAIVVAKPGATFDDREIIQTVKASVDSGVLPREAITMKVQRADAIDKTSVGKINKVALRGRFL